MCIWQFNSQNVHFLISLHDEILNKIKMPRAIVGIVLASLFSSCMAATFLWVGGNMSFSAPVNWENGNAPSPSPSVCNTTFGSSTVNIVSQLDVSYSQSSYVCVGGVGRSSAEWEMFRHSLFYVHPPIFTIKYNPFAFILPFAPELMN